MDIDRFVNENLNECNDRELEVGLRFAYEKLKNASKKELYAWREAAEVADKRKGRPFLSRKAELHIYLIDILLEEYDERNRY